MQIKPDISIPSSLSDVAVCIYKHAVSMHIILIKCTLESVTILRWLSEVKDKCYPNWIQSQLSQSEHSYGIRINTKAAFDSIFPLTLVFIAILIGECATSWEKLWVKNVRQCTMIDFGIIDYQICRSIVYDFKDSFNDMSAYRASRYRAIHHRSTRSRWPWHPIRQKRSSLPCPVIDTSRNSRFAYRTWKTDSWRGENP
jgi:hypothetical protein